MNETKIIINEQLRQLQMLMQRSCGRFRGPGKGYNPNRGQGRVLALLRLKPEISQKELTYLLDMSRQAVAELIAKLEKSGYVSREPSDKDKRAMTIKLSEEGAKAAESVEGFALETVLDCLNGEELERFCEYLGRIVGRYEEQFPGEDFEGARQRMEDFMCFHGRGPRYRQRPKCGSRGRGQGMGRGARGCGQQIRGIEAPPLNKGPVNGYDEKKE